MLSSLLRALALGMLVLFLATATPPMLLRGVGWTARAVSSAGESPREARRRVLGGPWVDAVEEIRRAVPSGGEYFLVNGGTEWGGGPNWARFDLAPRRALFLGLLSALPPGALLRQRLPAGPRWVVIAFQEPRPPVLMAREDFLRALDQRPGGSDGRRQDPGMIPP